MCPCNGTPLTSAFTAISHKAHAHGIECNINFKGKSKNVSLAFMDFNGLFGHAVVNTCD